MATVDRTGNLHEGFKPRAGLLSERRGAIGERRRF
jgi:hypothetical protein